MRVSYRHRFLFIHVDRTGGTSVASALDPFSYRQSDGSRLLAALLRRLGVPTDYHRWKRFPTQHVTMRQLREAWPDHVLESLFKFAFVRNPWDRFVSLYHARLQHPSHPEHELARHLGSVRSYARWWKENRSVQQVDYIVDEGGQQLVDFVGRFERLEADFAKVCERVGIRAKLAHLNSASSRSARGYREYFDDESRAIVEMKFADDIARFGYEF